MHKYDIALEEAESLLTELGERLEHPVKDEPYVRASLALGKRARTLFRGFVNLRRTDAAPAGFVLLRPAIEINFVLRFLSAHPDVHTQLWEADGELETLKLIDELEKNVELATRTGWTGLPAQVRKEREESIERARAAGLGAAVKGVSKKPGKSVLPGMNILAHDHGDPAMKAGYTLAYRSLSQFIHTSSRAFDDGAFYAASPGMVAFTEFEQPRRAIRRHRALNVTTFASTLTLLSEPLDLDALEQAARVRDLFASGVLEEPDA